MLLYKIINIGYLALAWWILRQWNPKFLKHKTWTFGTVYVFILSWIVVFGMLVFDIPIMVLDFHEPEVHQEFKEKWWVFPLGGVVFFPITYLLESLYLCLRNRFIGKPPDMGLTFEDLAVQSLEHSLRTYRSGEIMLYRLVVDMGKHHRALRRETASKSWKKDFKQRLKRLSEIDKVLFDSGAPELPEELKREVEAEVAAIAQAIVQARSRINQRAEEA